MPLKTILSAVIAVTSFTLLTGFKSPTQYQPIDKQTLQIPIEMGIDPFAPPSQRDLADCVTYYINGEKITICYP